jgi:hypothetical protein
MLTPYLSIWRSFHPVAAGGWDGMAEGLERKWGA